MQRTHLKTPSLPFLCGLYWYAGPTDTGDETLRMHLTLNWKIAPSVPCVWCQLGQVWPLLQRKPWKHPNGYLARSFSLYSQDSQVSASFSHFKVSRHFNMIVLVWQRRRIQVDFSFWLVGDIHSWDKKKRYKRPNISEHNLIKKSIPPC